MHFEQNPINYQVISHLKSPLGDLGVKTLNFEPFEQKTLPLPQNIREMKTVDKLLGWLLLAAIIALIAKQIVVQNQEKDVELPAVSLAEVQEFFPDAAELRLTDTSYYIVENAQAEVLGVVMLSAPYSDDVKGFNGPTPLMICLNGDSTIFNVKLLQNKETPGYRKRLEKNHYLESWNGMTVEEALNAKVDAVSGATYSSLGVQNSLRKRLEVVSRQQTAPPDKISQWGNICVLVIIVMALICFFIPQKTKTLRLITLLLSVGVIGFWQNALLSLVRFYGWLTSGITWQLEWVIVLLFVLAALLPLFTGKAFYCTYLCPMGALQEFTGKVCKRKAKISHRLNTALLIIRKLALLTILVLLLVGTGLNLAFVEPFSVFSVRSLTLFSIVFAVVILVTSLFVNRAWCRFLCPTGLLFDLVRKIRK